MNKFKRFPAEIKIYPENQSEVYFSALHVHPVYSRWPLNSMYALSFACRGKTEKNYKNQPLLNSPTRRCKMDERNFNSENIIIKLLEAKLFRTITSTDQETCTT